MPFEKIALLNVEPMKDVLDRLQIAMNGTHKFLEMLFLLIILFTASSFFKISGKKHIVCLLALGHVLPRGITQHSFVSTLANH